MKKLDVGGYLKKLLNDRGIKLAWVIERLGENSSFYAKVNNNTLSASDIMNIGEVLHLDLNRMKADILEFERSNRELIDK